MSYINLAISKLEGMVESESKHLEKLRTKAEFHRNRKPRWLFSMMGYQEIATIYDEHAKTSEEYLEFYKNKLHEYKEFEKNR